LTDDPLTSFVAQVGLPIHVGGLFSPQPFRFAVDFIKPAPHPAPAFCFREWNDPNFKRLII